MKKPGYIVLARKYRPQSFEEILGQPAVSVTLKKALSSKKIGHAYLFTGPRGVGKTTTARILAKALNCEKGPTPEPCGECLPCREIASSSCLDVLEMDAASHTSVDNVRQVIIETVGLAPSRDRCKVFIIDEAHMLSTSAFNALLKTLEEPPEHVVFILATTESPKIPATIASRCQRFRFRPVAVEVLSKHLSEVAKKEKIEVEPEALDLLARSADGSLRDAVSLLDQCHSASPHKVSAEHVRAMFGFVADEVLSGLSGALLSHDAKALAGWLQKTYEEGIEPAQLVRDLRSCLEEAYLAKLGVPRTGAKVSRGPAAQASAESLAFLIKRLNRTLEELRFGDSPRLTLELGLFGCLEAAGDLREWVERLERLEKRLEAVGARVPEKTQAPAGAAPSQVPPVRSAPASPVTGGADSGAIWAAVVSEIRQEKPSLAAVLEKASLAVEGDAWRLVFARNFELDSAKRSLPLIVAKLATASGRRVPVELAVGQVPEEAGEVVDTGIAEGGGGAPLGGAWRDVTAKDSPTPTPAPIKKAQEILGGKVRIVKKPS